MLIYIILAVFIAVCVVLGIAAICALLLGHGDDTYYHSSTRTENPCDEPQPNQHLPPTCA